MRINHLIIGCRNVDESADFYQNLLGFSLAGTFVDSGTGREGKILHFEGQGNDLDLMLVPFKEERLPNPQHVAFEVSETKFSSIYDFLQKKGVKVRAEPSLASKTQGLGQLDMHGGSYKIFYVLDPGGVNIEVMTRKRT